MSREFYSKYAILDKIGEGTFSEVSKCRQLSNAQTFAVKKLKKQFKHCSEALSLPELIVLEKLPPHPNVLPMIELIFDSQDGTLFIVFELMEMSLYELIQSRKRCLAETRVKHIFYQILKGLNHLHSHGIFHRDIKPENILIKKNVVKLADLGSVRGVHSQQPYTEYISTRWYRAPECILTGGCYGSKMDIWASGCVFFELLTSKPIFPGANEIDQLTKIHQVTGTPNPRVIMKIRRNDSRIGDVKFSPFPSLNLAVILPFTSEGGRELLKRMLVYDPDVRPNVRRLLEHRYFNDLRETECITRKSASPSKARQWNNPLLFGSLNNKTKPKQKVSVRSERKSMGTQLTTNSWAPSTTTSKVLLEPRKSKPNIDKKITSNDIKKRPGPSPVKEVIKKKPTAKFELKHIVAKQQKIKTSSVQILPTIKQNVVLTSKSQINGPCRLKTVTKGFLPPIPEK